MGHGLIDSEPSSARRLADAAWEHRADAVLARSEAQRAHRIAVRCGDLAAAAIADRAATVALFELGEPLTGLRRARRSVDHAVESGDAAVLAGALITLGGGLSVSGHRTEALDVLDRACHHATGPLLIDAKAQRAVALNAIGRRAEALEELSGLLSPGAPVRPDALQRAELLHDYGVVLALRAQFDAAIEAFGSAAMFFNELGHFAAAFDARRNLALVLVQAGRLPAALRLFGELTREVGVDPQRLTWLGCVQMEALIAANLSTEAADVAHSLIETAVLASADLRAEAWRLCAQALAMSGDVTRAAAVAKRAEPLFRRQGFGPLAAVTRRQWAASLSPRRRISVLAGVIDELASAGLRSEVVATRLDRIKAAAEIGDGVVVANERLELNKVRRSQSTAVVRLQAWLGEALALASAGDTGGAARAARRGLGVLDQYRASLGATELRAHASGIGSELAAIGMSAAFASGRPTGVFEAAEQWRASAVFNVPATSPELNEALSDLRAVLGNGDETLSGELDPQSVERCRQRAEQRVRQVARSLEPAATRSASIPSQRRLGEVLGDRTLIELVEHAGRYHAVVCQVRRVSRLVELGSAATVRDASANLGFALRRLARVGVSPAAAAAATKTATEALAVLDQLLVVPLGLISDIVVIVPPASLHAVPFPSLHSLADREVTVAPSATWWYSTSEAAGGAPVGFGDERIVLIAGPGLEGADREVRSIAASLPNATVLRGSMATAAGAMVALDRCDLAHLACHGRLRADHPHLSSLELFDGPFTVYDFERLEVAPRQVVLAACDSAVGAMRAGDELLGFLAALFGLGTHDVLASVVPVPDLATTDFMVHFHQALGDSGSFPSALGVARQAVDLSVSANFAASVAFVAFGIGSLSA